MQDALWKMLKFLSKKYYSELARKLGTNKIIPKCYWSVLKIFLNNNKILCIPPLIHNNQFDVDFKEKSELFNSFFAK